ncbi:C6 transcription factor [Pseudozyma hubeiensis]|nr:C6 transcription factor [Pseudozyma hubeiensis]
MSSRPLSPPPHRRGYYEPPPYARSRQDSYHDQRRASSHHHAPVSEYAPSSSRTDMIPPASASAFAAASYRPEPASTSNILPPSVQRPMHQLVPEQQHQLANIQRFTPSCSRCRQKKLKCDTNLPCNQCIAKGVHDDCRKDSRVPRGRKRPKPTPTSTSFDRPEDEVASLRKRVKQLEQMIASNTAPSAASEPRSPCASSHRPSNKQALSSRQLGTSSRGSQTSVPSEIGYSNSRERHSLGSPSLDSEDEEVAEMETSLTTLERLAASDPRVSEPGHGRAMHKHINSISSSRLPRRVSSSYFAAPAAFNERIEMIMLAKRLLPAKKLVDTLIHTFNLRCHNLVGRIIHMPSFQKSVDFFTHATVEELLTSPHDMNDLCRYLMVLRLGLRFYPWKGGMFIDHTTPDFIAINALKNRGDDISLQWLNLAKRGLALDRSFSLNSIQAIQTAILMILDGRDSPAYLRMLLRISIQTALDMGLHRLGNAMPSSKNPEDDIVTIESGVRIWWYLVVKDWCSAQREGAYTIHPSQMTTRKPLHTTDARLSDGLTDEISLDHHCETSYTLCQIELANIIRESIDLRNEQSILGGAYDVISPNNKKLLHVKLETFLNELPPFYRLHSTEMRPGVLAVQRCLLHQQTFDVLLKLNRKSLSSYSERATCVMLAEQIVTTQKLLRSVCPVIDGFWVNFLHLFGATLTLTISLLLDDDMSEELRDRRRDRVHIALATMRETPGSDRGSRIIETLLEEEQKQWAALEDGSGRRPLDLTALTKRIVAQTSELAETPARIDGAAASMPGSGFSHTTAQNMSRAGGVGVLTWDTTPDESVIPAFASSWGVDITDPTGLLSALMPQTPDDGHANGLYPDEPYVYQRHTPRPYEQSLRPWQEPSQAVASGHLSAADGSENSLWEWMFSQAALLLGPEPPIEGDPQNPAANSHPAVAATSARTQQDGAHVAHSSPAGVRSEESHRQQSDVSSGSSAYPSRHTGYSPYSQAPDSSVHSRSPHASVTTAPSVLSPLSAHQASSSTLYHSSLLPNRAAKATADGVYGHSSPGRTWSEQRHGY